jgi:NAD(P)-dependent dehydrogenase (short-subunit alcohol dehydrogenase family)
LTAALAAFTVTGAAGTIFYYIKSKDAKRKRRARRSQSGARTDVVVVAGAVANPLTSALYLDLERRGFVVYVLCPTAEDEHFVRSQSRVDLLPLPLDLLDPFTAQSQLARFQNLLDREHHAFDHAEPHKLRFTGVVLVPDTQVAPMRLEDTTTEDWSDVINAKVLNTIAQTQLLLPAVTKHKARVLLLTSSVAPSLSLSSHSMETAVYGALQGFAASLAAELKEDDVPFTNIKVGNVDIPAITAKQRREGAPAPRLKPTPIRRLHDTVFDTLVAKSPSRTL